MWWGAAFLIVFLITLIPLGVSTQFDSNGLYIRIIAGLIRFTIFPLRKKKKPAKPKTAIPQESASEADVPLQTNKTTQAAVSQQKTAPAAQGATKSGGKLTDFLPLVQVAFKFLNSFRKKLRVNRLDFKLIMANDDPCDLAVNYGKTWAIMDNMLPYLERFFVIKKRNLEVECDFCTEQTRVIARMDLTVTVGRLIGMACKYGFLAIRELLILKKKRKGGATA